MRVGERVSKHRAEQRRQGMVRVEVLVPAEAVEQVRTFASRLRSRRAKVDLAAVRALIAEAFEKYGASCLDNIAAVPIGAELRAAPVIADALMKRGNNQAFVLGRRLQDQARV